MRMTGLPLVVAMLTVAVDSSAQECTSDPDVVVRALYAQILERAPDRSARAAMYDIAATGRGSVRSNVAFFARSPEHQARFLWPPVVDAVFRATRGAPAPRGLIEQASTALAQQQVTVRDLVARFAADEAETRGPEGQIAVLYARVLGRDPDVNGARDFAQMAARDGLLPVARVLASSREYQERFGTNGVPLSGAEPYKPAIQILYRHLLGRAPDEVGLDAHARTAAEHGFGAVVDVIVSSEEYLHRFGEHRVPGRGEGGPEYCGAPPADVERARRSARPR